MKSVYLEAYFRNNLGDDMFVRTLLRRFPDVRFFSYIPKEYCSTFLSESNFSFSTEDNKNTRLARITRNYYIRFLLNCIRHDAIVKIGGSIFMQKFPDQNTVKRKPTPLWIKRIFFRRRFIIGANFGPYFTQRFLELGRAGFKCHKGVCFRDSGSYELFKDIEQVHMAPDVLFGYRYYPAYQKGNGVGISVIAPENKQYVDAYTEQYYNTVAEICDILSEQGISVKLYGFCRAEGDETAAQKIIGRMKSNHIPQVLIYNGDIDDFLDKFNECEYVLAGRFHAMILGFMMHKKVLPVIYSQKQSNVLSDMNYEGGIWDLLHGELPAANEIIHRCWQNTVPDDLDWLARESSKQFAQLEDYLYH